MGIYRPRTHREGDHFHFSQQIFILSKEELAGPAEEQIFCPAKLPMPRDGAADLMVSAKVPFKADAV
jgi:hypothetical protein